MFFFTIFAKFWRKKCSCSHNNKTALIKQTSLFDSALDCSCLLDIFISNKLIIAIMVISEYEKSEKESYEFLARFSMYINYYVWKNYEDPCSLDGHLIERYLISKNVDLFKEFAYSAATRLNNWAKSEFFRYAKNYIIKERNIYKI